MNSRTYSTECSDDDDTGNAFNTAMRMSEGQSSNVTNKTVSISQYRTKYDFGHSSVEHTVNSVQSTTFILSVRDQLRRHLEDGGQTIQSASHSEQGQNKASLTSVNTELKVKADKPNITNDIILPVPVLSKSSKNWETVEELTADNLDESNIWPALSTLELSYSQNDGNSSTDHKEIIEKLNQQFNYSPRKFTESLVTIIEESFVLPDESADGLLEFVKKSQNVKQVENESIPELMVTPTSDNITNISLLSMNDAENNEKSDSTQYMSYRRKASPEFDLNQETPKEINLTEAKSESSTPRMKRYSKTPGLTKNRKIPKISVSHRLRVGCDKSPRGANKTFIKTPKIVINPGTPQAHGNQCEGRQAVIRSWDNDDYLTAESDTEEPEPISVESEEPRASSSLNMDMNRFKTLHRQWTQAYEKVEKSTSSKITDSKRKLATHGTKLENRLLSELQQKRQRCFDLIEQLITNNTSDASSNQNNSDCTCTPCNLNTDFLNILRACSDYFAYGMNARDVYQSVAKNKRYISSVSLNLKKNKGPSSHVSAQHVRSKSPRKSLSRGNVRFKSPGARCLSPYSKSAPKRRLLKNGASPVIDRSSLRPVSQLRSVFSPGLRAADGHKPNTKVSKPEPIRSPEVTRRKVGGSGSYKFRHVVSPIARYIKGDK